MKKIIYEDENIKCIHSTIDDSENSLVITFGDAVSLDNEKNIFFGESVLAENKYNCIGVMPKFPHWYPLSSILNFIKLNANLLSSYPKKIGFGSSMGAYGAIKYSKLLGTQMTIAMAPQWSIDPSECHYYPGFQEFYSEKMKSMGIGSEEIWGNIFIFYDPYTVEDLNHAKKIKSLHSNTYLIKVASTGHAPLSALKGSNSIKLLFTYTQNLSLSALYLHVNHLRRLNPARKYNVIKRSVKRRPIMAAKIIINRFPSDDAFKNIFYEYYKELLIILKINDNRLFQIWVKMRLSLNIELKQKIINELILGMGRIKYIQTHTKKFLFFNLVSEKICQSSFSNDSAKLPIMAYVHNNQIKLFIHYYEYPIYFGVTENFCLEFSLKDEADIFFDFNIHENAKFSVSFKGKYLTASCSEDDNVSFGPSSVNAWEMFEFIDASHAKLWK